MTLILKLDLDMVKMYLHTKNEVFYVKGFKIYSLNRQTDRQTDTQTHRHDQKHYLPTYAGGNKHQIKKVLCQTLHNSTLMFKWIMDHSNENSCSKSSREVILNYIIQFSVVMIDLTVNPSKYKLNL